MQACRALAKPPRVVFTSSVASFSGGQEAVLGDDARQVPGNSYGAEKAAAELFLADATPARLPGCGRRPAADRHHPPRPPEQGGEQLRLSASCGSRCWGCETELPVRRNSPSGSASPRRAVDWLLHAMAMDTAPLGLDRSINPPGRSATVGKMLAALEGVAGPEARARVKHVPDAAIEAIVGTWPASFTAERARRLHGFSEQESLEEIVQAFIEDDLAATRAERGL